MNDENDSLEIIDLSDELNNKSNKSNRDNKSDRDNKYGRDIKSDIFSIKNSLKNAVVRTAVFFALIVYLEYIFHFISVGNDVSYLPLTIIMCLPTAVFFSLLTMFLPAKAEKAVEPVLFGVIILYYVVNLLYHSAFKVYFSIKFINASNTKITQYYRETWDTIKANRLGMILMIVLPVFLYVTLRCTKVLKYERVTLKKCYIPLAGFILSVGLEAGVCLIYGKAPFSPYDLMTGENVSEFSFARLGVAATGEIELKNMLLPEKEDEEEFTVWVYEPDTDLAGNAGNSNSVQNGSTNGNVSDNVAAGAGQSGAGGASSAVEGEDGQTDENAEAEKVIDTSPNMLDIDFAALAESDTNSEIAGIDKYFASVEPSYKNEYTGMFEGYNLIFLTCEAFCPLAVDEELTPTLYKLVNEGFVFNNFYNPRTGGSTSDGEFVCSTSLVPTNGGATNFRIVGQNSMPFALGNMFNMKYGITSRAYHDNDYTYYDRDKTYPGMGYYYVGVGNGLNITRSWPESDLEMMQATIPDYIDDDIFHVYYMTVSGHMNYNWGGNAMSAKHKAEVDDLPYSDACKAYLACQMELDRALEYLIEQLEEKGIADRTVICFTGDHWPYGLTNEEYSELLGHEVEENFELYKSNLVLWSGSIEEPIEIDKYCSSMDILPTLLNLFGFDYDSRLLMGRDILSNTEGYVMFINRSLITDKLMYNSQNGQVTYLTDETLPDDYLSNAISTLNNRWKYSQKIMDTDYYSYICNDLGIEIPVVEQNYD